MAKNGERRRTMVYSNVNRKADKKSASKNNVENDDVINLDDEVVIGLAKLPEPNVVKEKKNKNKKKSNNKGNDDLKTLWENEKEELAREEKLARKKSNHTKQGNAQKTSNTKKVNNVQKNSNEKNVNKAKNTNNAKKEMQVTIPKKQKALTIQERIKKQKRKIIRRLTLIALLILLLIGGLVYLLLSPVFNVKSINVVNNNNISSQSIISLSGINLNENMFKFSKREAKKAILSNPYIEEVKIKRKPFSTVEIDVKERVATLMLEYGNSYVYINNQGFILEISTEKLDVPMLTGYVTPLDQIKAGNRLSKDDLERLTTVLNIMEVANSNGIGELITKIDIKSKKDYILTLESEDKVVYLGECTDLSTQMLYVKKIVDMEKGIEGEIFVDMDLNKKEPVFREKV